MTGKGIPAHWRLPALLAAGCAGLAALVAAEVGMAPDPGEAEVARPSPAALRVPAVAADDGSMPEFVPSPLDSFVNITERPLFTATRRPAAAVVSDGPATPQVLDTSIQLAGVILSGGRRVALIQLEGVPRPVSVEVGNTVGGWKVESIGAEAVVLRSGETTREITLSERLKAIAAMAGETRPTSRKPPAAPERGMGRPGQQPPRGAAPARMPPGAGQPTRPGFAPPAATLAPDAADGPPR